MLNRKKKRPLDKDNTEQPSIKDDRYISKQKKSEKFKKRKLRKLSSRIDGIDSALHESESMDDKLEQKLGIDNSLGYSGDDESPDEYKRKRKKQHNYRYPSSLSTHTPFNQHANKLEPYALCNYITRFTDNKKIEEPRYPRRGGAVKEEFKLFSRQFPKKSAYHMGFSHRQSPETNKKILETLIPDLDSDDESHTFKSTKGWVRDDVKITKHDELLKYSESLCTAIINNTERLTNFNLIHGYNYPCVNVECKHDLARKTPNKVSSDSKKAWSKLFMSLFAAIADHLAYSESIKIEIVIRQGFGFITPSVSETATSFRIDPGFVPQSYMKILSKALNILDECYDDVLNHKLEKNTLIILQDRISQIKVLKTKKQFSIKEILNLHVAGGLENLKRNSLIEQMLQMDGTAALGPDILITKCLTAFIKNSNSYSENIIEIITQIISKAGYNKSKKFSLNYDTKDANFQFNSEPKWKDVCLDDEYSHVLGLLQGANKKPNFKKFKVGFQSESEEEIDFGEDTIYAKKLTVSSGMFAISVGILGLISYLGIDMEISGLQQISSAVQDMSMYYEVCDLLKILKIGKSSKWKIFCIDLNPSQVSTDNPITTLMLDKTSKTYVVKNEYCDTKKILVLDITSSTITQITQNLHKIFSRGGNIVLLVNSGTKHSQGRKNILQFGTIRIFCRGQATIDKLYNAYKANISIKDHKIELWEHDDRIYLNETENKLRLFFKENTLDIRNKYVMLELSELNGVMQKQWHSVNRKSML